MNPFVVVSSIPTCPPPTPPAPLLPPAFALTGTGPMVSISALPDDLPFDLVDDAPAVTLRVVPPARSRAARAPFIALVLALLGGGLVTLLLINTALSQGAFAVQKLQRTNIALTEAQQQLNKDLADADQPQALASKAVALGMVPGGAPAFLRLPDGKVLGAPKVAVPLPVPAPTTTAAASVAPSASPGATTTPAAPGTPGAAVTSAEAVPPAAVTSAVPPAVTTAPAAPAAGTAIAGAPATQGTPAPPTPVTPTKGKP